MADRTLYDEDILAWADQQAAALRDLGARRDLPNQLDLANVIEEIEDVGRSELNAVASYVRLMLSHAVKAWADPRSRAMRHWAAEVGNWQGELLQHVTPSMRAKVNIGPLWQRALRQAELDLDELGKREARARIAQHLSPDACPLSLDDLCQETSKLSDLAAKVAEHGARTPRPLSR